MPHTWGVTDEILSSRLYTFPIQCKFERVKNTQIKYSWQNLSNAKYFLKDVKRIYQVSILSTLCHARKRNQSIAGTSAAF